jgi:hypothetical protein
MKIEVTAEDIKTGRWSNVRQCPIAKALSRALGGAEVSVWGDGFRIVIEDGAPSDGYLTYRLPHSCRKFVTDFDHKERGRQTGRKLVKPFSFDESEVK